MDREDLGGLAQFLVVADERSFTRAAAKLGLSQSALSHAMRRLEERLGLRLLNRTTRSVAPTEAGAQLIETLRPALSDIGEKLSALTALRDRPAGTVRISSSRYAARSIIWPAVDRLTRDNPDIHVEIDVADGFIDIVAEGFDAGVRLGESLEQDMVAMRLGPPMQMVVVASPDYVRQHGRPQTPHDLAEHQCINLRLISAGGIYAWEFSKDGRELRVRVKGHLVFNDGDLRTAAALAGHGYAMIPRNHVEQELKDGRLVSVLEDWCEPFDGFFLYYPNRKQHSPAFTAVLQALRYTD